MRNEALGLWNIGEGRFHTRMAPAEAKRIIKAAYREGMTTFDSAYSYTDADTILCSALKEIRAERESWRIIEKVMPVPSLERKTETILRRLNTTYIDILLIHWPSEEEALYSSLKTLEKLKANGTAGEIGVSNFPVDFLKKVIRDFPVTCHERPLSLVWNKDRLEESKLGIKTICYAPFGFGILSSGSKPKLSQLPFSSSPHIRELKSTLTGMAEEKKTTAESIALSWVYTLSPHMIIRGVSNPSQIDIPLINLTEDEKRRLDNLSSMITAEADGDNIFNHNWKKDAETEKHS